jgi:hypothetical protein
LGGPSGDSVFGIGGSPGGGGGGGFRYTDTLGSRGGAPGGHGRVVIWW